MPCKTTCESGKYLTDECPAGSTSDTSSCTECPEGYRGNGADEGGCEEVNFCADEMDDCDPNSLCDHTGPGTHSCWCNFGFEGPGKIADGGCIDIDECDPARKDRKSVV